jgi:cellulose synthase (UDP-forming)
VAREGRQVRGHVRRLARMPVTLYFADGRVVDAVTSNVSTGGLAVTLPEGFDAEGREITDVDLQIAGGRTAFPVQGVALRDGELRVMFIDVDDARERRLIQALMARADLWQPEPDRRIGGGWVRAVTSLLEVSSSTLRFISRAAWLRARSRLRLGAAVAGALAVFVPGFRAQASALPPAVAERVFRLATLPSPAGDRPAPLRCGGKTAARLDLPADQVVLAARLEHSSAAAEAGGAVVTVNGQTAGALGAAGSADLEPAVFLPGANEVVITGLRGAECGGRNLRASDLRIVLSVTPLAPAPDPVAAQPAPVQPQIPQRAAAAPVNDARSLFRRLLGSPPALALLAFGACAVLARPVTRALDRQAEARLDGLAELQA